MLDEFSSASLQMARDGGSLPRGPCGGGYTGIMTACPATMMIVGATMKGCFTFDPEEAFAIVKDNHSVSDIPNDGSLHSTMFDAKSVTRVRFQVTGGSGINRGLSEIEVLSDTVMQAQSPGLR